MCVSSAAASVSKRQKIDLLSFAAKDLHSSVTLSLLHHYLCDCHLYSASAPCNKSPSVAMKGKSPPLLQEGESGEETD